MILVDSSVWIDYFRGNVTPEADRLDALLVEAELVVGDIVLTEVLQGFATDAASRTALGLLSTLRSSNWVAATPRSRRPATSAASAPAA